jgi:hypothetical protein
MGHGTTQVHFCPHHSTTSHGGPRALHRGGEGGSGGVGRDGREGWASRRGARAEPGVWWRAGCGGRAGGVVAEPGVWWPSRGCGGRAVAGGRGGALEGRSVDRALRSYPHATGADDRPLPPGACPDRPRAGLPLRFPRYVVGARCGVSGRCWSRSVTLGDGGIAAGADGGWRGGEVRGQRTARVPGGVASRGPNGMTARAGGEGDQANGGVAARATRSEVPMSRVLAGGDAKRAVYVTRPAPRSAAPPSITGSPQGAPENRAEREARQSFSPPTRGASLYRSGVGVARGPGASEGCATQRLPIHRRRPSAALEERRSPPSLSESAACPGTRATPTPRASPTTPAPLPRATPPPSLHHHPHPHPHRHRSPATPSRDPPAPASP